LRTNYEQEKEESKHYAQAYLTSAQQGPMRRTDTTVAWTNFEQKYDDIGEPTYELKLEHATTC
jgi:hypothetical protein